MLIEKLSNSIEDNRFSQIDRTWREICKLFLNTVDKESLKAKIDTISKMTEISDSWELGLSYLGSVNLRGIENYVRVLTNWL